MSVQNLIQGPVLDGLQQQNAIGDEAFNARVDLLANATGYAAGDIVAAFNEIVSASRRAAIESDLMSAAKSYTVSASITDLFTRGEQIAESLSDEDSKVVFNLSVERVSDGTLRFVTNLGGRRGRASSGTSSGSNIDGWTAYQRGTKKGDAFNIERVGRGEFRDATRGEDIPTRGLIKWILTNYADSQAAAILTDAGKTL